MAESRPVSRFGPLRRLHEAVTRISRERRMDWRTVPWEELPDLEKEAMADAIQEVFAVPVLPAGWALVPTVPTPEMYAEGERAKETGSDAQGVYIRMLDTAPQPPACDPSSYFAASEKQALQPIRGVGIEGGYVIVTPVGVGTEPPRRLREQILELFPVEPRT